MYRIPYTCIFISVNLSQGERRAARPLILILVAGPIWPVIEITQSRSYSRAAPLIISFSTDRRSLLARALELFILFHLSNQMTKNGAGGEISDARASLRPAASGIIHRTRGLSPDNIWISSVSKHWHSGFVPEILKTDAKFCIPWIF